MAGALWSSSGPVYYIHGYLSLSMKHSVDTSLVIGELFTAYTYEVRFNPPVAVMAWPQPCSGSDLPSVSSFDELAAALRTSSGSAYFAYGSLRLGMNIRRRHPMGGFRTLDGVCTSSQHSNSL